MKENKHTKVPYQKIILSIIGPKILLHLFITAEDCKFFNVSVTIDLE